MSLDARIQEIKLAADEFIRRLTRWLEDSNGTTAMPEAVKTSLAVCNLACSGDIPECCRTLATIAVPRLVEEMRKFNNMEEGCFARVGPTPVPAPRFWAAIKSLMKARAGAEAPAYDILEPVMDLIAQGVSTDQIGQHIYGFRGEGPFLIRGVVSVSLIKQQAEYEKQMRERGEAAIKPVIEDGWIPPWQRQDVDKRAANLKQELAAIDRLEHPKQYEDPATVEELLREGAFIQQIEKTKHVSRQEIIEAATRIGVVAQDQPGFRPPVRREVQETPPEDDESGTPSTPDGNALKELVIEAYLSSNDTKGTQEIAAELKKAGHEITTGSVAQIIQHYKKRQKSEAVA